MRLKDKVAVVTGGARGIGRAIAERYVAEGAVVAVADMLIDEAETVAAAIGPNAFAVPLNVTSRELIEAMADAVVERAGRIDILVNGAGVFDMAPLAEVTDERFDTPFDVNVKGLFFTTQAVTNRMRAAGHGGKVINFSSQAGRRGEPLVAVYCATKAAVISLTQSMALELIRYGINVNGIAPGVVETPMWDHVDSLFARYENRPIGEKKRLVGEAVPYGRMGTPEDMAGAAVFLASADSDYVIAQTLNVDGGNCMN